MATCAPSAKINETDIASAGSPATTPDIEVALLTGGQDKHYSFGLAMALATRGVRLDFIGGEEVDTPELHSTPNINFLNLRGNRPEDASLVTKASRVLTYYARLFRYALTAKPKVFHVLWNNKFEFFDRTILTLYYKLCGKKIAFTAHNVNIGRRDSRDSLLNRLTLKLQYRLVDHIFVHTERMKDELCADFEVCEQSITVLDHPLNIAVPDTRLTPNEAKAQLGIRGGQRTILFFGAIAPYKGLDFLITAFQQLVARDANHRLIIAGKPKGGCEKYFVGVQETLGPMLDRGQIIQNIRRIPDDEIELYFKAADVLVLPYREIYQSGVLFLAYRFGLPVVAADVGSLREAIIEGRTGFLCRPNDPGDLANMIERYFESDLFRGLDSSRKDIREYAQARHSWDPVGQITRGVYARLLRGDLS